MDEVAREDRQAEGIALAMAQELLERLHGGVKTAMPAFALVAMRAPHAARGVEHDLDIGQLALDFRRLEGDRMREEQHGDSEQASRQAVGDEHEATQEPAATALAAVVRHRKGLTGAHPLPEGQNDREGQ